MLRILLYSVVQCLLLVGGQVFLKFALMKMMPFGWTKEFWLSLLGNWQFAACGAFFGASSVFWMYIVKTFPFSMAYPMISLSYVFGMIAAMVFFHEDVSLAKWVGIAFIITGCFLIAK